MSVFKAYDIRGVYKEQIDEKFAYSLGKSIGSQNKYNNILVGNDIRIGSKELVKPFIVGLIDGGANVKYGGTISTPIIYFSTKDKYDLGVILTASHNPSKYTGFKMCNIKAIPISPTEELIKIYKEYDLTEEIINKINNFNLENIQIDVISEYMDFFLNRCCKNNNKIAIDFANGSTSIGEKEVLKQLLPNSILINDFPDGTFPAHEPDTLKKECLEQIIQCVKENNCELGVIFDGDGDRIGIIDEKGEVLQGDILTLLIAMEVLKEKENGENGKNNNKIKIVYDLRCSKIVEEVIKQYGGEPIKTRVGHYFIKKLMHEVDAEFAGELSNHFYFKEAGYVESPLLALNYILNVMEHKGKSLSQLTEEYKKYYHSGEINFKVEDKLKILEKIENKYKDSCKIEKIDGLSVYCNNWWFNIRLSNTEPLLRLNLEGDTKEIMEEKLKEVKELIK